MPGRFVRLVRGLLALMLGATLLAAVPSAARAATLLPLPPGIVGSITKDGGPGAAGTFASPSFTFIGRASTDLVEVFATGPVLGPDQRVVFQAPPGELLAIGRAYEATRYPLQVAPNAGLDVSGNGVGCNTSQGVFVVRELQFDPQGALSSFDAVWSFACDSSTAVSTGEIRLGAAATQSTVYALARFPSSVSVTTSPATVQARTPTQVTVAVSLGATAPTTPVSGSVILMQVNGDRLATTPPNLPLSGLLGPGATATVSTAFTPPSIGVGPIRAYFVPDDPTVRPSTAGAPLNVTRIPTSISVTASATTLTSADTLTVDVTIQPPVAGSVNFQGVAGGSPTLFLNLFAGVGADGHGSVSRTAIEPGTYVFQVFYTPTDSGVFEATGTNLTVTVTAPPPLAVSDQTVQTNVAAGALTVAVPDATVPVATGGLALDPTGTLFVDNGSTSLHPITVTDQRPNVTGFTVTGQTQDLTDGAGKVINGENVGWRPILLAQPPITETQIFAGPEVQPARGEAPGVFTGAGLRTARTLVTASQQPGATGNIGTVTVSATLLYAVPVTTPSGTYSAIVTFTVL